MITYCTYFDHIERGGFKPEIVLSNWNECDKRVVCCSPSALEELRPMKLDAQIIDIGYTVEAPSDIPKAMNASVDACFDGHADWVVFIFGDVYLTKRADGFIRSMIDRNKSPAGTLLSMGVSLYTKMYAHVSEVLAMHRDHRIYRDELADGDKCVEPIEPWTLDETLALDIGYIGTPQYYTKMRNHRAIWPDSYKDKWLRTYESGKKEEAVKMTYESIRAWRRAPLVPMDDVYKEVVDILQLQVDYEFCQAILRGYL